MSLQIEIVSQDNFEDVLPMIAEYQTFYKAEPDGARNRAFFVQLLRSHERGIQFIAYTDRPIGFCTVYFNFKSTRALEIASLNDLYVREEGRGLRKSGTALALMDAAFTYAREHGYPMLEGKTTTDNFIAQKFYEHYGSKRLGHVATRSSHYIYLVDFEAPLVEGEVNAVRELD